MTRVSLFSAACLVGIVAQYSPAKAQVEEIIVTAQKREENLQDIPITMQAITSATIDSFGIKGVENLPSLAPGLQISRAGNATVATLRGVGNQGQNVIGNEGSTVIFVDGIYIPAAQGGIFSFDNIERIEVLKGPQGTLFGRNATGGVIHVITRTPSHSPKLDVSVGYGNFDTYQASLYGTAELTSKIAADLSVYALKQNEGWGRNTTLGIQNFKKKDVAVRSKWLIDIADNTSLTLTADYGKAQDSSGSSFALAPGARGIDGVTIGQPRGSYNVIENLPGGGDNDQWGISARLQHEFSWADFVSLTSYRDLDALNIIDQDGLPLSGIDAYLYEAQKTVTQEVQLLSPKSSPIAWVTGFYYLGDTAQYDPITLNGSAFGGLSLEQWSRQKTNSYAGYGQITVPVTDRLKVTGGLRYTIDKRHVKGHLDLVGFGPIASAEQSKTFKKLTFRAAVDYRLTDDVLAYLSFNRGFKSGVFGLVTPSAPAANPEVLDAFEGGFKTDLFDKKLRLNLAGYHYNYKDLQLQKITNGSSNIVNAASAKINGIDADFEFKPTQMLTLMGGMAYVDAKFGHYPDSIIDSPVPTGGNVETLGDVTGNHLPLSPRITLNIAASIDVPTEVGKLDFTANYGYTASYFWKADNRLKEPAKGIVDAAVTWTSPSERYDIKVWVKNLTDRYYLSYADELVQGDLISPAAPRTFGVRVGAHF